MMKNKKLIYGILVIVIFLALAICIILSIYTVKKKTIQDTSKHKTHSIVDTSNIPQSFEECNKQKSYISNDLVCYYDFIIQNNDALWGFCKENGRVLPPNPPNSSACRLSYYNSKSNIPIDFDECVNVMHNSYDLAESYEGPYSKFCQLEIRMEEETMTPNIKKLLFTQCSNHPSVGKTLSDSYCSIRFFK